MSIPLYFCKCRLEYLRNFSSQREEFLFISGNLRLCLWQRDSELWEPQRRKYAFSFPHLQEAFSVQSKILFPHLDEDSYRFFWKIERGARNGKAIWRVTPPLLSNVWCHSCSVDGFSRLIRSSRPLYILSPPCIPTIKSCCAKKNGFSTSQPGLR